MIEVRSPHDGSVVARVEHDTDANVESKLARAVAAHRAWREIGVEERCRRLRGALAAFASAGEDVALDVTRQMGKPIAEARREVDTMLERAEACVRLAPDALAPETVPGGEGLVLRVEHEPLGVVLDIAAWNYPLLISVNVVVPALLAGNAVLLKHSERTPLCGDAFERAFAAMEPKGLLASLALEHEAVGRLIDDRRIAHVAFTGSVRGGRAVYARAASRVLDCGLELGGKDAAYVAADADLESAVAGIVDGACYNAGQSCCAVERVYVAESVHAEVVERARALMEAYRLGDPLDPSTTLGPLCMASTMDLLEGQVAEAVAGGGRLVTGGLRVPGSRGHAFPATLVDRAPQRSSLVQVESFGPVLPVVPVKDDEEAVRLMDDSPYGLTASVWTTDAERAERIARRLEVGTVYQNRCDYLHPLLPWTGARDSGIGSTLSRHGFYQLTRRKAIHFRRT